MAAALCASLCVSAALVVQSLAISVRQAERTPIVAAAPLDEEAVLGPTSQRAAACAGLRSAARLGWTPTVVVIPRSTAGRLRNRGAWDAPWLHRHELAFLKEENPWSTLVSISAKTRAMKQFVDQIQGDPLVFINDATDVLYTSSLGGVSSEYVRLTEKHAGGTILYSSEDNCYPLADIYNEQGNKLCKGLYPGGRYLNSGGMIGPKRSMLLHLELAAKCADRIFDDQLCAMLLQARGSGLWNGTLLAELGSSLTDADVGEGPPVALDLASSIWHTTGNLEDQEVCQEGFTYGRHMEESLAWHFNSRPCKRGFKVASEALEDVAEVTDASEYDDPTITLFFAADALSEQQRPRTAQQTLESFCPT